MLAGPRSGEGLRRPGGQPAGESEHVDLLPAPAVTVSAMMAIEGILDRAVERLGVAAHFRVDGEVGVGATDSPHVCRPKVTTLAVVGRLVEGHGDLASSRRPMDRPLIFGLLLARVLLTSTLPNSVSRLWLCSAVMAPS